MARPSNKQPDLSYFRQEVPERHGSHDAFAIRKRRIHFLAERVEIAVTVAADAVLVAFAIVVRHYLLQLIHWADPESEYGWILRWTEIIADYFLLGCMLFLVVFDLAKRVKNAWTDLFRE